MKSLTPERAELLYELYEFMVEFFNSNGFPPAVRHITTAIPSISHGSAQRLRQELVEIKCLKGIGKGTHTKYIPIAPLPDELISLIPSKIPIMGVISAGRVTTTFSFSGTELTSIPVEGKT